MCWIVSAPCRSFENTPHKPLVFNKVLQANGRARRGAGKDRRMILDATDRAILNQLQEGFPIDPAPLPSWLLIWASPKPT